MAMRMADSGSDRNGCALQHRDARSGMLEVKRDDKHGAGVRLLLRGKVQAGGATEVAHHREKAASRRTWRYLVRSQRGHEVCILPYPPGESRWQTSCLLKSEAP